MINLANSDNEKETKKILRNEKLDIWNKGRVVSQVWYMTVIPALRMLKQDHMFQTNEIFAESYMPLWVHS